MMQTNEAGAFSLLSWNIWCKPKNEDKIDGKFHNIKSRMRTLVHIVKERNPAILVLSEFSNDCNAYLGELDQRYDWKHSEHKGEVRIGIRKGSHIEHDEVHQTHQHGDVLHFSHDDHCRGNWFRIKLPGQHKWITLAGVHLASGQHVEDAKRQSLGRIFDYLKDKKPSIVMGDLNWYKGHAKEDAINIKEVDFHEHFVDCAEVMDNEKKTLLAEPKYSWRLDRIFFSKNHGLYPLEYDLVGREDVPGAREALKDKHTDGEKGDGKGQLTEAHFHVSDHLGLYAKFGFDHHE